jgi:hypothetical protein
MSTKYSIAIGGLSYDRSASLFGVGQTRPLGLLKRTESTAPFRQPTPDLSTAASGILRRCPDRPQRRGSGHARACRVTSMVAEMVRQQYLQKRKVGVSRPRAICGRLRVVKDFERVAAWSWQPCVRPFCAALTWPLALMPSADRVPVKSSHSRCCGPSGFSRSPVRPVLHNVLLALSNHCVTRLGART